jgi:uncharacterized protein YgiM (DUF1202 family)
MFLSCGMWTKQQTKLKFTSIFKRDWYQVAFNAKNWYLGYQLQQQAKQKIYQTESVVIIHSPAVSA